MTGRRRIPDWKWERMSEQERLAACMLLKGIRVPTHHGSSDPYNISSDHWYQLRGSVTTTTLSLRQSIQSKNVVEHSVPAMRMVRTLFPLHMTVYQLRHFHRVPLDPDMDEDLREVEQQEAYVLARQREREQNFLQTGLPFQFKARRDLSARDGTLILAEYCEEYPPLLMRTGMATHMLNYFKRDDDTEERSPELPFGTMVVLGPKDPSPFLGKLKSRECLQSFENNLFRSPVYAHAPNPTDFLIIRSKGKYYIRTVAKNFTVGQECPKEIVPAPNSKLAAQFIRDRLEWYILRCFKGLSDNEDRTVRAHEIRHAFENLSEGHIRSRLKEFAEFVRNGGDTGSWRFTGDDALLSEANLNDLMSPERVCAYESMQAGLQRLLDAGFGIKLVDEDAANKDDDELQVEDEIKIAPWHTTVNFVNCIEGKCLLTIQGKKSEPTGCGEGFSYLRLPNKPLGKTTDRMMPNLDEYKKSIENTLVGTDADQRSMTFDQARNILIDRHMMPRDEVMKLGRWEAVRKATDLETERLRKEDKESKWARNSRSAVSEQRDRFNESCQRIFELQSKNLASDEILPDRDDDEQFADEDSDFGSDLEDQQEALKVGDDEEADRAHLQAFQANLAANTFQAVKSKTSQSTESDETPRRLVITRSFPSGSYDEVITDPKVISAYLRYMDAESAEAKRAAITGGVAPEMVDPLDAKRREDRRIRDQQRRLAKRLERQQGLSPMPAAEAAPSSRRSEKAITLVCGSCGQMGHVRTNKLCPNYGQPSSAVSPSPAEVKIDGTKVKFFNIDRVR